MLTRRGFLGAVLGTVATSFAVMQKPPELLELETLIREQYPGWESGALSRQVVPMSVAGPDFQSPGKAVVTCQWEDVPHLSEFDKGTMRQLIPLDTVLPRSYGVPNAD